LFMGGLLWMPSLHAQVRIFNHAIGVDFTLNIDDSIYQDTSRRKIRIQNYGFTGNEMDLQAGHFFLEIMKVEGGAKKFNALKDDCLEDTILQNENSKIFICKPSENYGVVVDYYINVIVDDGIYLISLSEEGKGHNWNRTMIRNVVRGLVSE